MMAVVAFVDVTDAAAVVGAAAVAAAAAADILTLSWRDYWDIDPRYDAPADRHIRSSCSQLYADSPNTAGQMHPQRVRSPVPN